VGARRSCAGVVSLWGVGVGVGFLRRLSRAMGGRSRMRNGICGPESGVVSEGFGPIPNPPHNAPNQGE